MLAQGMCDVVAECIPAGMWILFFTIEEDHISFQLSIMLTPMQSSIWATLFSWVGVSFANSSIAQPVDKKLFVSSGMQSSSS